jgi:hypothetical protein
MKTLKYIIAFYVALLCSSVAYNLFFEEYIQKAGVWSISSDRGFTYILFVRGIELIVVLAISSAFDVKLRPYIFMAISGVVLGIVVSEGAAKFGLFKLCFYYLAVLALVFLYNLLLFSASCIFSENRTWSLPKLHNKLLSDLFIVTILLICCYLELKILKFF